jgi:hypothetical protein
MALSEKKLATNRANAKKSTGPVSIVSRRNSSRNSTRHGILADVVLLEGESRDRFIALVNSFVIEFQPATPTEETMVQKIAVAHWRQMRIWAMDSAGINHEMHLQAESMTTETAATRAIEAPARFRDRKILPNEPTHFDENKGVAQTVEPTAVHPEPAK